MEVLHQTCQSCGATELRNLLVREPGRAQMVFVSCARCSEFVARYRLESYYHAGKGIESYLRSLGSGAAESGRQQLDEFHQLEEEATTQYQRALEALEENPPAPDAAS